MPVQRVLAEWFGAVGDGVTDDTAAIMRALKAIEQVSGGVLETSLGSEYRIDRPFHQLMLDTFGESAAIEQWEPHPDSPRHPAREVTVIGGGYFVDGSG